MKHSEQWELPRIGGSGKVLIDNRYPRGGTREIIAEPLIEDIDLGGERCRQAQSDATSNSVAARRGTTLVKARRQEVERARLKRLRDRNPDLCADLDQTLAESGGHEKQKNE